MNQNTPGYSSKITIRNRSDKNGRSMAHYWGSGRWIRMKLAEAKLFIATQAAWDYDND